MTSPLSIHWIPAHRGSIAGRSDRDWFALWDPSFVKILTDDETVPYLEDIPPAAKIIVRNYPLSELGHDRGLRVAGSRDGRLVPPAINQPATQNGSGRDQLVAGPGAFSPVINPHEVVYRGAASVPEEVGRQHAQTCNRIAQWCEARGIPRSRLWFEGLNEPMLWSVEPPSQVARYYRQFILSLHEFNLRGVAGNFGVGWPGNGGVQDQPVQWDFFKPVVDAMCLDPDRPDYLGLHEYWGLNGLYNTNAGGPSMWRWWAGRYEQCPFDVPILITEVGIDTGVTGNFYGGWANLPGQMTERAERYLHELGMYWDKAHGDGRIMGIFPFSYDRGSDTWVHFDIRNEDWLRTYLSMTFVPPAPWRPKAQPEPKPEPKPLDPLGDALKAAFGPKLTDLRGLLPSKGSYPTRSTASIRRVIVHHTAVTASTPWKDIASYHVNTKGWAGIGYHIGISPDGQLFLLNGLDKISNHASGHNSDSIGIVFAGNYQTDELRPGAYHTFDKYLGIVEDYLGRELEVRGHRDVGDTACPGNNLYRALFEATDQPSVLEVMFEQARNRDLYRVNPGAALRREILADGRIMTTPEYTVTHDGREYICQVAHTPADPLAWVYWCERDKWDVVHKEVSHA